MGFPHSSVGKESTWNAGDLGSIHGSGRSAGEGIGYPLHCSWASLVAQLVKNPPAMWETWVRSLGWEDPLGKGKATHSSILAWRIPWRPQFNCWIGKIPWRRVRLPSPVFLDFPGGSNGKESAAVWETWVQFLSWEDPLEEGMATHSSILAWRIQRTEEPDRLQSTGSQGVEHD